MINENFKQLSRIYLQSFGSGMGFVPVASVTGFLVYASPNIVFPGTRTSTVTLNATAAGISFGTGDTPATATDINLENTVTSGVTTTITSQYTGVEGETGEPFLITYITITNTSGDTLTINEVGYKQTIKGAPYVGSASTADYVCLIDRTVLEDPLVIENGDAGVLTYKLKTVIPYKTKNNVKIVPWEFGSDADITAMIQAAHAGTIDLQEDAGWKIGMKRPVTISAFTGGGNVAHESQTIDFIISSFDDYENCGCVMQFDFYEALKEGQRINDSGSNIGGYGRSEVYTTTLPALVQALPQYLQDMLITFTCKASEGNMSSVIEEITGNKLALRSVVEIKGTNTDSAPGEGSQIPIYTLVNGSKQLGRTGSTSIAFTRSPNVDTNTHYCVVNEDGIINRTGNASANPNTNRLLAPFGCL